MNYLRMYKDNKVIRTVEMFDYEIKTEMRIVFENVVRGIGKHYRVTKNRVSVTYGDMKYIYYIEKGI